MIRAEELHEAEVIEAVNNVLERAHQRSRNPQLVHEIEHAVASA